MKNLLKFNTKDNDTEYLELAIQVTDSLEIEKTS